MHGQYLSSKEVTTISESDGWLDGHRLQFVNKFFAVFKVSISFCVVSILGDKLVLVEMVHMIVSQRFIVLVTEFLIEHRFLEKSRHVGSLFRRIGEIRIL